ncbi:MAG: potassium channel protein [Bacteroidales bacterium]|nr:potassium channel protein [Bacteroidales bacterium]
MEQSGKKRILAAITMIVVIIVVGVTGFMLIEGDSFIDAFYMTIITISTVGFGEIHVLSIPGKLFTMFLILLSFGTYAYAISIITTYFVEGRVAGFIAGSMTRKSKARKMDNHIIICGYGRNGQQAAQELKAHKQQFIIIESKHEVIMENLSEDIHFVEGDATNDEILEKAKIHKAKALITTLPNDADNTYVTLTARALNKQLIIISRATNENSEKKLKVAGVNNVVMPERVGGAHMATLVARPDVFEFLENLSVHGKALTNLDEIVCNNMAESIQGKRISELKFREKTGANIIGLKTSEGEFILNPSPDLTINTDSKLFVLGTPDQIENMKQILREEFS